MIDRCDDHQLCVCVCTCVGGGAGRGGGGGGHMAVFSGQSYHLCLPSWSPKDKGIIVIWKM